MEDKIEKPINKKLKDKITPKFENYYFFIFICIIAIELFLIFNSSRKSKEQKKLFKDKHNILTNRKNNISELLNEIEINEQEIKSIEMNSIPKNKEMLQICQSEQNDLITTNNNLSELYQKSFEDYESKKEILNFEINEKNSSIKELLIELKDKVLIRTNLEEKLDILEEKNLGDIPKIRMKSTILENDDNKKIILTKWLSSLGVGEVKKYKLIFSASEHDFDSFSFHEICGSEDIKNTLIIIKTEKDDIIGGFTFASWGANSLISYDDKAFVFNLNKEMKFRVSSPSNAIHSKINDGPIFGMYDLIINLNKLKVQEKMESYGDKDLGIGSETLNIANYEVFNVVFN